MKNRSRLQLWQNPGGSTHMRLGKHWVMRVGTVERFVNDGDKEQLQ